MMDNPIFPILILIGRPASGKSEIIDFLQRLPPTVRRNTYHLGELLVLDDFPMVWTWFEEDHLLSTRLGKPRLHTDAQGYFKYPYLWHLLIERLSLEYEKCRRDRPNLERDTTVIIEFARGAEHGGYQEAFAHLAPEILARAVVLYVAVSFQESRRKNRRRFNPERPDSILEHSLPDEKMERLYREDDWAVLTAGDADFLTIGSYRLPYAILENEDDVTTGQPDLLADRLQQALDHPWALRHGGSSLGGRD